MHVVVNAAMSADGKLSTRERRQVPISGSEDFDRVDRLRASVDAVMVGVGTVLADDPHLTVKDADRCRQREANGEPPHPARVVADSAARTPPEAAILDDAATTHMLVAETAPDHRVERLSERARVHRVGTDRVDLVKGISALAAHGIDDLLVEGGGELIFSLLEAGLVDRLYVFVGNRVIGGREAPTLADGAGFTEASEFVDLALEAVERLDDGVLLEWSVGRANRDR